MVCGPPLYSGVMRPLGALISLSVGKTSAAMLLTVFRATVAVAAPLSAAISTPAIRNRVHIPRHSEGGRSSCMGYRHGAAHRGEGKLTPPPDDAAHIQG